MYDHIICGRASVHFKFICSCTCTYVWKEDTCTCTSKMSILFFFTLCSIWTLLEHLYIKSSHMNMPYLHVHTRGVPALVVLLVECPLRETWGHGFNPRPRPTKVFKNCTSCSSLGTQTYGEELGLVKAVSGYCDWVWYHVKCLGHNTSVRIELPVTARHRRIMTKK